MALHTSLPFSENLKLIMKTSHNQHADMLIFLLALNQGETNFDAGVVAINPIIEEAGIDPSPLRSAMGGAISSPTCSARARSRKC